MLPASPHCSLRQRARPCPASRPGPRSAAPSAARPRRTGSLPRPPCPCWNAAATRSTPRRRRLRAADAGATPERPGRGGADPPFDRRPARGRGPLRPGCCAAGRDHRALPRSVSTFPGTGLLAACVPDAFGAWMRLLRDHGPLRGATCSSRQSTTRAPATRCSRLRARRFDARRCSSPEWPNRPGLPGGRRRPGAGRPVPQPRARHIFSAFWPGGAGGSGEAEIAGARRRLIGGFVAEAIDDFCRVPRWSTARGGTHRVCSR